MKHDPSKENTEDTLSVTSRALFCLSVKGIVNEGRKEQQNPRRNNEVLHLRKECVEIDVLYRCSHFGH